MTDADARWAEAVITAFPHLNVAEPHAMECCCGKPFTVDGVTYERVNAGCAIHGLKSRYIEQPGHTMKAAHQSTHKHTMVRG